MSTGLNVGRIVRIVINLAARAVGRRGFGVLLVLGDSDVIDANTRIELFTTIEEVAGRFGTSAKEYLAAVRFFAQAPRAVTLAIGRWLRTATAGFVKGSVLTSVQQTLATWTAIEDGSFTITIDGDEIDVGELDFSGELNLNGVAEVIATALGAAGTCTWDGERFRITSATTGVDSEVSYASATDPAAGTDIATMLRLTAATATAVVAGAAAETALAATSTLASKSGQWYGLMFGAATMPSNDALVDVADYIEGTGGAIARIFGVVETDTRVLDAEYTTDLASRFKAKALSRTLTQYSQDAFAIASFLSRAFSVDFTANKSVLTMKFKREPGVIPEDITETEAQTLAAKNCNVYVKYNNDTAILQEGVMADGTFFDRRHGFDWLGDALQNALYNALYQAKRKIPQTNSGMNELRAVAADVMRQAVNNGLLAPGVWNGEPIGILDTGDPLPLGFYIFVPPIELQDISDRGQRIAPTMQIAANEAGAVHFAGIIVDVNR